MVRPSKINDVLVSVEAWKPGDNKTYFLNNPSRRVISGLVINWGRDSLLDKPRNRTATLEFGPYDGSAGPAWWLYRKVSIKVGDTLLFMGVIDSARQNIKSFATGDVGTFVEANAVEGTLFDSRLHAEKDILIRDLRSFFTPWEDEMRRYGIGVNMPAVWPIYAPFYEPVRMSMKKTLELGMESSGLLTQPQWLPNHQHIHPTINKRWDKAPITDYIPASNADVSPAEATIEKTPRSWVVSTGGEYGNKTVWFQRENLPGPIPSPRHEFNVPVQWNHGQQHNSRLMEDSMQLLQHLQADPQQVTIIDGGKQELETTAHLRTWETPDRGIKFTGTFDHDRFRDRDTGKINHLRYVDLHDDKKYWYPIGGQLRITHEKITHRLNAIKIAPTG